VYITTTTVLRPLDFVRDYSSQGGLHQKGKTRKVNQSGFTEARDSEWQWHQMGHMQICALPQTDNHASIPLLSFLQARQPSCHSANSVKALKVFVLSQ